jgi:hypothetical protein
MFVVATQRCFRTAVGQTPISGQFVRFVCEKRSLRHKSHSYFNHNNAGRVTASPNLGKRVANDGCMFWSSMTASMWLLSLAMMVQAWGTSGRDRA